MTQMMMIFKEKVSEILHFFYISENLTVNSLKLNDFLPIGSV